MDYIDYELQKYYEQQDLADKMAELGFETYEEYADYLADLEADYQERLMEARMLDEK